ncbi:MAG: hypothetical protein ACHREM_28145 [Polyangiales bacterium]
MRGAHTYFASLLMLAAGACTFGSLADYQVADDLTSCANTDGTSIAVGGTVACSQLPNGTTVKFPTGTPTGICKQGTVTCQPGGVLGTCVGVIAPSARNCKSPLDNDCDGTPDASECAGCLKADGTNALQGDTASCFPFAATAIPGDGPCVAGTKTCVPTPDGSNVQWNPCSGQVGPKPRDCTSPIDNDCDGKADNTECGSCTSGATQVCYDGTMGTQGVGACKAGTQTCIVSGGSTTWGLCTGEVVPAAAEDCTNATNDANCNGEAASAECKCIVGQPNPAGCGATGQGCTPGAQTCLNGLTGAYSACTGNKCVDFPETQTATCTSTSSVPTCTEGGTICPTGTYITGCTITACTGSGYPSCSTGTLTGNSTTWTITPDTRYLSAAGTISCNCRNTAF